VASGIGPTSAAVVSSFDRALEADSSSLALAPFDRGRMVDGENAGVAAWKSDWSKAPDLEFFSEAPTAEDRPNPWDPSKLSDNENAGDGEKNDVLLNSRV
jgi:hypothetical protein